MRESRSLRLLAYAAIAAALGVLAALTAGEIVTRQLGYAPKRLTPAHQTMEALAVSHDQMGWVNRPGSQVSMEDASVTMRFSDDYARYDDARTKKKGLPKVLVIGCSYTEGYSVGDSEVYSARLNAELPEVEVVNFGTAGYSAYQSLLRMSAELEQKNQEIKIVVYGFIDHHLHRNVAERDWVLAMPTPTGGIVMPPHVRVKDGALVEYPGYVGRKWPGENRLALVHLARTAVIRRANKVSEADRAMVQRAIVERMRSEAHARGAKFLAVGLEFEDKYASLFKDVAFADCRIPGTKGFSGGGVPVEYRVAGAHPNARAHAYWSNCIKQELQKLL